MIASAGNAAVPDVRWAPTVGALTALGYLVLVGGGTLGELDPVPRVLSALIAACFLAAYLWRAPRRADRLDKVVLVAVVALAGAALFSQFPRQSLDAVLAALAYAAGLFIARGLLADAAPRLWFMRALIALSAVLTVVTFARWLPPVVNAMTVSGFNLPPLNLELSARPWGHRYDLALLVALMYPAWWIGRPSRLRQVVAIVVGVLVLLIVLITGSRSVWAALGFASLSLLVPAIKRNWQRLRVPIVVAALALGLLLAITGVWSLIVDRTLNSETLAFRGAMWGPLVDAWSTHPMVGFGPGSFPWILQLTAYFDVNSFAPRHPDNAIIQQLVEGGLIGVVATLIVAVVVLPAVLRGESDAARWAVIAFAVACIGGNPSDIAFVVVVVLAWVAYGVPRRDLDDVQQPETHRSNIMRTATLVMFAAVVGVSGAVHIAAFSYERARSAVASGDLHGASDALNLAVALDPVMAIYLRQRGTLALVTGDLPTARAHLQRATQINPADDVGWRSLALANLADGADAAASAALGRALALQRSDPTNLMLTARVGGEQARTADAVDLLAEVVQAWPAVVGAPGWLDLLPPSVTSEAVIDAATARWENGQPMPEVQLDQALWLVALADRQDLEARAVAEASIPTLLAEATIAVTRCDPVTDDLLDQVSGADRRSYVYQLLRQRAESVAEPREEPTGFDSQRLNPLNENGVFSADAWGYRRPSIDWPSSTGDLPSPAVGWARWTLFPRDAVRAAELNDRLPLCP